MCFAFTGMYQTFVNKKPVVQLVTAKPLALNTQYGAVQFDSAPIVHTLNLILFALFMMFLAVLGAKVAGIGNQLLKTERICETLETLRAQEALAHQKDIKKL